MNIPLCINFDYQNVKGIREPHEVKKKPFDLGGKRTHDLRIRSTVTPPTGLRGRTEKVGLTRNAVGTRAAGEFFHRFFVFSHTFTHVSITR